MSDPIFYTFEHGGERLGLEFGSKKLLIEWADQWWADRCQDEEGLRNGEVRDDEGFVITYSVDEDGEVKDLLRERYVLSYEHYHGDYKEHCTYY